MKTLDTACKKHVQQHISHIIIRKAIVDRCALEACEAISKAYVSTCPHQKRRVFNELNF